MPGCNCAGKSCNCSIVAKANGGIAVTGTGTASDPFTLSVNAGGLGLGTAIVTQNTDSVKMSKTGSGNTGDPVVLSALIRLVDANNVSWKPSITTAGVVTWVVAS